MANRRGEQMQQSTFAFQKFSYRSKYLISVGEWGLRKTMSGMSGRSGAPNSMAAG